MRARVLLLPFAALAACAAPTSAGPAADPMVHDVHSCARPHEVRVTHLDLDLTLDFAAKVAHGQVRLRLLRDAAAAPLWLDTLDLDVEAVTDDAGAPLEHRFGAADPILGTPLQVTLPRGCSSVVLRYRTRPGAAAMQWLAPAQTAGGRQPFLFTQGQAILTRSWIPLQDTPSVRQTWTARIQAPPGLQPVMSAMQRQPDGSAFTFAMTLPVPSYLIALACGDLARAEISPRCAIWAESSVLPLAAREFEDTEQMVAACEQLFGPYRWGRYDVLVLPPSFPFGGMENPCLTFATPTVLAGDKSLVALVAHELAHSWSGNLVTNATWSDFWLNEGFTVYLEQRIMAHLYGQARADMETALAMHDLQEEMRELPPADQVLHLDLQGRNPDDGVTGVPYDKGAAFLRRLDQAVGRERFDAFVRAWFATHAFRSVTTADFEAFLQRELLATTPSAAAVDVAAWIHQPGLPADAPIPQSRAFAAIDALQADLCRTRDAKALRAASAHWTTQEWLRLLHDLPPDAALLAALDAEFQLGRSGNCEILAAFLELAIRADYAPAMAPLREFLLRVGRRKFLEPLYKALAKTEAGLARARAIYQEARPRYHTVTVRTVDELLGHH